MTQTKIVDRIRKLLKLSDSTDVNEAANAAAMAQRLMERHNIQAAVIKIEDDGDTNRFKIQAHEDPLASSKDLDVWQIRLAQSLAGVNGCEVYLAEDESGRDVCLVGSTADAENVGAQFAYLVHEIDRLAKDYGKPKSGKGRKSKRRKKARKRSKAAIESFCLGAVDTVHWKMLDAQEAAREAARKEAKSSSTALATLDKAIALLDQRADEARRYYEEVLCPEAHEDVEGERDWDAYAEGVIAGASLDLNGHVERKEIEN